MNNFAQQIIQDQTVSGDLYLSYEKPVANLQSGRGKEIYNIPGSGWKSPDWNWGYGVGTGHDGALICRRNFSSVQSRKDLIIVQINKSTIKKKKSNTTISKVKNFCSSSSYK